MQFVAFWHTITRHDPQWLSFDSQLLPQAELSRVNERGSWLVTIRRRGAALLRRRQALPPTAWRRAVLDSPKRRHPHVRSVDETTTLRGYTGAIRQVAVDGLGHPHPLHVQHLRCECPGPHHPLRGTPWCRGEPRQQQQFLSPRLSGQ